MVEHPATLESGEAFTAVVQKHDARRNATQSVEGGQSRGPDFPHTSPSYAPLSPRTVVLSRFDYHPRNGSRLSSVPKIFSRIHRRSICERPFPGVELTTASHPPQTSASGTLQQVDERRASRRDDVAAAAPGQDVRHRQLPGQEPRPPSDLELPSLPAYQPVWLSA